jgi:MerR family transcriptional regulator, heat shock protein HspR
MEIDSGSSDADPEQPSAEQGVYGIGVTSDLVGTGIQNLRAYERAGLVMPSRTPGGTRLYSPEDVARLRRIQALLGQGLNLAGVGQVLDLQDDNERLRDEITSLTAAPDQSSEQSPDRRPGSRTRRAARQ